MAYRISSSMVLIVFILKFFILYINAIPPPPTPSPLRPTASHSLSRATTPLNSCNCTRATDCAAYTELVRQLKGVIERMRNTSCGLAYDSEPMVCCPANARTNKLERSADTQAFNNNMHNDFSKNTAGDRWVWDRRPITSNDDERKSDVISIQSKFLDDPTSLYDDFATTNLLNDYYDWKTQRNCPPILYREKHNFRTHFDRPQHHGEHYDGFHHAHPSHPHHRPHDPHFEFNHNHNLHHGHGHEHGFGHSDFGDEYDDSHHEDAPVIYPDSRHPFRQPPTWSDPAASASNNRDQHTTTPITTISTPTTTTTQRPTINSSNCGVTLNKRIIGGIEALPGEFPWITRIAYLNRSDSTIAYRCSGSFVTELHIITAAHCVTNLAASLTLSNIRINDLNGENDQQQSQSIYEIADTFVHPNFDTPKRANDIAIIKIIRPEGVVVNYGTICLPTLTNFGDSGTGVVAGWSNNEGNLENDLRVRYLRLPILNNTECSRRYEMFRQGFAEKITIDRGMLCTQGLSNGSDVCRGDSGGPLMHDGSTVYNSEGRYTLLGIVAFGPICGFTNLLPGVYMRVSEFVDWISSTVR